MHSAINIQTNDAQMSSCLDSRRVDFRRSGGGGEVQHHGDLWGQPSTHSSGEACDESATNTQLEPGHPIGTIYACSTRTRAHARTRIYTHAHTHAHAQSHMHTHTHTHIPFEHHNVECEGRTKKSFNARLTHRDRIPYQPHVTHTRAVVRLRSSACRLALPVGKRTTAG